MVLHMSKFRYRLKEAIANSKNSKGSFKDGKFVLTFNSSDYEWLLRNLELAFYVTLKEKYPFIKESVVTSEMGENDNGHLYPIINIDATEILQKDENADTILDTVFQKFTSMYSIKFEDDNRNIHDVILDIQFKGY